MPNIGFIGTYLKSKHIGYVNEQARNQERNKIFNFISKLDDKLDTLYKVYQDWEKIKYKIMKEVAYAPDVAQYLDSLYHFISHKTEAYREIRDEMVSTLNSSTEKSQDKAFIKKQLKNLESRISGQKGLNYTEPKIIVYNGFSVQELGKKTEEIFSLIKKIEDDSDIAAIKMSRYYKKHLSFKLDGSVTGLNKYENNSLIDNVFLGMMEILYRQKDTDYEISDTEKEPAERDIDIIFDSFESFKEKIDIMESTLKKWDKLRVKILRGSEFEPTLHEESDNIDQLMVKIHNQYIEINKDIRRTAFTLSDSLWDENFIGDPKAEMSIFKKKISLQKQQIRQLNQLIDNTTKVPDELKDKIKDVLSSFNEINVEADENIIKMTNFYDSYIVPNVRYGNLFPELNYCGFNSSGKSVSGFQNSLIEGIFDINKLAETVSCFGTGLGVAETVSCFGTGLGVDKTIMNSLFIMNKGSDK